MTPNLITQETIKELVAKGTKRLTITPGTIVTSSASELAASNGIQIVESPSASSPSAAPPQIQESQTSGALQEKNKGNVVAFGSDHGGFELKELLKKHAVSLGFRVLDVGTSDEKPCDYPEFAYSVARAVSDGEAWRGVMIDGVGTGSCVVANKVPGIRAACCHNEFVARNAREHNDTNVLTLGSRVTGTEVCKEILRIWLETWFSGGRHKQRVDKIADLERRFMK